MISYTLNLSSRDEGDYFIGRIGIISTTFIHSISSFSGIKITMNSAISHAIYVYLSVVYERSTTYSHNILPITRNRTIFAIPLIVRIRLYMMYIIIKRLKVIGGESGYFNKRRYGFREVYCDNIWIHVLQVISLWREYFHEVICSSSPESNIIQHNVESSHVEMKGMWCVSSPSISIVFTVRISIAVV